MGHFLTPNPFIPNQPPILIGTTGQVLTNVGGKLAFANAGSGGSTIGALIAVAPGAGVINNYAPAGFGATTGRLDIDTTAGNVELTGLIAGSDGQLLNVRNSAGANNIILDSQNAASAAANRFALPAQMYIPAADGMLLVYYGGTVNRWCKA